MASKSAGSQQFAGQCQKIVGKCKKQKAADFWPFFEDVEAIGNEKKSSEGYCYSSQLKL
jgi:hypothetical protein